MIAHRTQAIITNTAVNHAIVAAFGSSSSGQFGIWLDSNFPVESENKRPNSNMQPQLFDGQLSKTDTSDDLTDWEEF